MTSTHKFLIFFNVIFLTSLSSSDLYYPENIWELSSPESQNVDSEKVNKLINLSFRWFLSSFNDIIILATKNTIETKHVVLHTITNKIIVYFFI